MQITRKFAFSPVSERASVFAVKTAYVSFDKPKLMREFSEVETSDTFGDCYTLYSRDNGATWSPPQRSYCPEVASGGTVRRSEHVLLHDVRRGRVLRFFNRSLFPDKEHTPDVMRQTIIQFEISEDEGQTFSLPSQLIVDGYSDQKWMPGVCYGKNCSLISFSQPFFDKGGRIILPAQWNPILPEKAPPSLYPLESLCFIGETGEDGRLIWKTSQRVSIDPEWSVRGLCEPTISELSDGRMIMICRGSNANRPDLPARKWMTISSDQGDQWSPVKPLGYDTGELFFSPGAGSRLLRSSFNGKLYWIGNILPKNPDGGVPRHPLCIAEMDENIPALRKQTAVQIDGRRPGDSPCVQLSNFHVYEDRLTGEFVVLLARLFERSESLMVSPAYEYRVGIL